MGLALDESKDTDEIVKENGITVVADKSLVEQLGGIDVGFKTSGWGAGFIVRPKSDFGGSCSC